MVDLIKTEKSAEFHSAPRTVEREDGSHKQIEDFGAEPADQPHEHHGQQPHSHAHDHHHGHGHGHHDHHHQRHGHEHVHATHQHENVIAHRGGFTEAEMDDFFSAANLKLVNIGKSAQFVKDGKRYDNFLAIAQKAS